MARMRVKIMVGNLSERKRLEDLGVDGSIILTGMLKKQGGECGRSWTGINLAQDGGRWRVLVNMLMRQGVTKILRI